MPQDKRAGHVRCKVCGSTKLREKYGKMECEQCGARYTIEQMRRTVLKAEEKSAVKKSPAPQKIQTAGHSKKTIAICIAAIVIIAGVALYCLMH